MKKKIKYKFFMYIFIVSLVFIVVFVSLYMLFFDKYVLYNKKNELKDVFRDINNMNLTDITDEQYNYIQRLEFKTGARINIFRDTEYVYGIPKMAGDMIDKFNKNNGSIGTKIKPPSFSNDLDYIKGFVSRTINDFELSAGQYVYTDSFDRISNTRYINIAGILDNSDYIYIKMPMIFMTNISRYTSIFVMIASLVALTVCAILGYIVSRQFSHPIVKMNKIANQMSTLDFSSKYDGACDDEIGELGYSLNKLSEHLEKTIVELKKTNKLQKDLLINVSHDLKTPIALIQGYAEGLKVGINEEARSEYCDVIIDESIRMGKIVNELLDLSRVESGIVKPNMTDFDIRLLIEQTIRKNDILIKSKSITVENDTMDLTVHADRNLIQRVLINLITNSIDHVKDYGKIIISSEQIYNKLRIKIFNTGENIPDGDLENIWYAFYKVDKARSRAIGGTGIGLSIVKSIMDIHKQSYGVNNLSDGVEFYFELQIVEENKTDVK